MATPSEPTSDADLTPPRERTFHELIADIRTRVFAGVNDAQQDEDLRLFVLCRQILNHTPPEIAAEMIGWGIPGDYANGFLGTSNATGHANGPVTERATWTVGGFAADLSNINAAAATRAGVAARKAKLYQQAARMVADEPRRVREDLNFGPSARPSESARGRHTPTRTTGRPRRALPARILWPILMAIAVLLVGGFLWLLYGPR